MIIYFSSYNPIKIKQSAETYNFLIPGEKKSPVSRSFLYPGKQELFLAYMLLVTVHILIHTTRSVNKFHFTGVKRM